MKDYLSVLLSVLLLAVSFIVTKLYQLKVDDTTKGVLNLGIASGFCSIIILICTSGFSISFTWYSVINALLRSACCLGYSVIGYKIMREANMALYMLFLMSGGMLLPTIWGWLFLGEEPKTLHILGTVLILVSVIIDNLGIHRPSGKVLLMCSAVFVLNGFVSVFSKLHQSTTQFPTVPTLDYAFLSSLSSLLLNVFSRITLSAEDKNAGTKKYSFLIPLGFAIFSSVIGVISNYLQLEGAKALPASMLYPMITGGNIAFTGILAFIFFKEKLSARGWTAIALCCLGTCFFI